MLALATGAVIYLSNRFALFFPVLSKNEWMWGFIALFFIIIVSMSVFMLISHPIGKPLYIVGGIITSLFVFTLMFVAITDSLNLIFNLMPQVRGLLSVGFAVLLTGYGVWNAFNIKIREVEISIKGLTQEIRTVHISDVHLGSLWGKRYVEKIADKIKELNPDVIFNTGDMFEGRVHFRENADVLGALRELEIPHFFVYGNHDKTAGLQKVINQMENANITVLRNEIVNFGELQIIGLDHMLANENTFDMHAQPGDETIKSVMERLPVEEKRPVIVLHHSPDGASYMQAKGVDLLLAGHTHAGQIFPFTFFAKMMFRHNSGLYKHEMMNIYVSEGTGTIFLPVRFGTRSEIALIRLVPNK